MRYIDVPGVTIPKHCIYGPRPSEGIVLNNIEWWSITDHLVKAQREKEFAAVLKAKEEAKKDISFGMTQKWSNTLASIKTKGDEKRLEKLNKIKQDRIDAYNEIIKNRKEEKRKILQNVKKIIFDDKDAIKTIRSGVLASMVLDERRKQIEMKKKLEEEQEKKDKEWDAKLQKDKEEYEKEKVLETMKEKEKQNLQKEYLAEQLADIKKRREEEDDHGAELQDLVNMEIEGEKIHKCNMVEKNYRKNFAARYIKKTELQLELERTLELEEEEENEINKIYKNYERRFKKERREREEKIKSEQIERREKISEMLAQKLAGKLQAEEERHEAAVKEIEEREKQEEEYKKERKRQSLKDLLDGKRNADVKAAKVLLQMKEKKKWDMMQVQRSAEINEAWREAEKQRKKKMEDDLVEVIGRQCKENAERREAELKEQLAPLEDEEAERKEILDYCDEIESFAIENKLPLHPIQEKISAIKESYGIRKKRKEQEEQKNVASNDNKKQKLRSQVIGCYCFKY